MGFALLSYVDVDVEVEEGILINQIHSFTGRGIWVSLVGSVGAGLMLPKVLVLACIGFPSR